MSCEVCMQQFNLTNRYPVQLPCCNETICRECENEIAGTPQQETFKCPIAYCGEESKCNVNFKINKYAEKQLRESLSIFCDKHPNDLAEYYCQDHDIMICKECTNTEHSEHQTKQINKMMLVEYHKIILEKLGVEYKKIGKLMTAIESYQKNQQHFTATQYLKRIRKTEQILLPQMKTEEEKEMIKFANQIQELPNQPEQIPQIIQQQIPNLDSLILSQDDHPFIIGCFGQPNLRMRLLYRATRDTFDVKTFHTKCDCQGPTLTLIKSEHNKVFGGYASVDWTSDDQGYKYDKNSFLISVTHKTKHTQYQHLDHAVYHYHKNGPVFGYRCDICIHDNSDADGQPHISSCNLGGTYSLPEGMVHESEEAQSYLAGSNQYKVLEIEVFRVNFI